MSETEIADKEEQAFIDEQSEFEDLGLKIGTPEEVFWTDAKRKLENSILQYTESLKGDKLMLDLAASIFSRSSLALSITGVVSNLAPTSLTGVVISSPTFLTSCLFSSSTFLFSSSIIFTPFQINPSHESPYLIPSKAKGPV